MRCAPAKKGKMRNISEKLINHSEEEFIIKVPCEGDTVVIDKFRLVDRELKLQFAQFISMFILACEGQLTTKEANDLNKKSVFLINKLKNGNNN